MSLQSLHVQIKENRSLELKLKDQIAHLRQELEEAKERKKISMAEKDQFRRGTWEHGDCSVG